VVVDALLDALPDRDEPAAVVRFIEDMLGGEAVTLNDEVARSGDEGAHLDRALAHLAKHFENLNNEVDEVIEAYGRQCAIELSCVQLARAGRFLMLDGADAKACRSGAAARRASRVGALMMTCGAYDAVGDFAFRVGLPAKSGVGGGILAVAPHQATIAVWSPGLDENGNSLLGTLALEMLTDKVSLSVFGAVGTAG
jgi:glutaminase